MARLVLPVPPGPVRVRRRTESSARRRSTSSSSARRPTNAVPRTGRFPAAWSSVVSGGNVDCKRRMHELEDALGAPEVLEPVLAEVAQARAVREVVRGEGRGGRRQEHLPAVPGGHDPGGAVDGRTEVVVAAPFGVPAMDADPDAERPGLRPCRRRRARAGWPDLPPPRRRPSERPPSARRRSPSRPARQPLRWRRAGSRRAARGRTPWRRAVAPRAGCCRRCR